LNASSHQLSDTKFFIISKFSHTHDQPVDSETIPLDPERDEVLVHLPNRAEFTAKLKSDQKKISQIRRREFIQKAEKFIETNHFAEARDFLSLVGTIPSDSPIHLLFHQNFSFLAKFQTPCYDATDPARLSEATLQAAHSSTDMSAKGLNTPCTEADLVRAITDTSSKQVPYRVYYLQLLAQVKPETALSLLLRYVDLFPHLPYFLQAIPLMRTAFLETLKNATITSTQLSSLSEYFIQTRSLHIALHILSRIQRNEFEILSARKLLYILQIDRRYSQLFGWLTATFRSGIPSRRSTPPKSTSACHSSSHHSRTAFPRSRFLRRAISAPPSPITCQWSSTPRCSRSCVGTSSPSGKCAPKSCSRGAH
jgi:hypothetical protein